MVEFVPSSIAELADLLREHKSRRAPVELGGAYSKTAFGGPRLAAAARISSQRLTQLLAYEPADLTISVEAGMPYAQLEAVLAENRQMLPLDPPFSETATVGGVLAADSSGPRRRRFGTARDLVIGMQFVTIEGKSIRSGGMVVKNVTGLDMAKLLIGSYGTLAAIVSANFKVLPQPETAATLRFESDSLAKLAKLRRLMVESPAQPFALDLLDRRAAAAIGLEVGARWTLAVEGCGSEAVARRYQRDYRKLGASVGLDPLVLEAGSSASFWNKVRRYPETTALREGGLVRIAPPAGKLAAALDLAARNGGAVLARAGAPLIYAGYPDEAALRLAVDQLRGAGFRTLIEAAPPETNGALTQWEDPGAALSVMQRLKDALDPEHLLNPGRLFQRI